MGDLLHECGNRDMVWDGAAKSLRSFGEKIILVSIEDKGGVLDAGYERRYRGRLGRVYEHTQIQSLSISSS